jgi:hypothetical protein
MQRSGPVLDRLKLRALRSLGMTAWRLGAPAGLDLFGSTEGPPIVRDPQRDEAFERLLSAGDGTVHAADCPYPVHELLTYLVTERGLLLHGSNNAEIETLEPQPARDFATELHAVVTCDDGIWPLFFATVARKNVQGLFNACLHTGRSPRLRRFYFFAITADPAAEQTWTEGAVYAMPRTGFRREWGNEWVCPDPVRPVLRVLVRPEDFPLRDVVLGVDSPEELRTAPRRLRQAKRERRARSL